MSNSIIDRLPEEVRLVVDDLSVADWLRDTLRWDIADRPRLVRDVLPAKYETYVRVMHSVLVVTPKGIREVPWVELATANNERLTGEISFRQVAHVDTAHLSEPSTTTPGDSLPAARYGSLAGILSNTTHAVEYWMLYWDGYGWYGGSTRYGWTPEDDTATIEERRKIAERVAHEEQLRLANIPTVVLARYEYYLFAVSLDGLEQVIDMTRQTPNVWWPSDRAWCAATPVHSYSSYIGGSREIRDAVLRSPDLEAFEVTPDSPIDRGVFAD